MSPWVRILFDIQSKNIHKMLTWELVAATWKTKAIRLCSCRPEDLSVNPLWLQIAGKGVIVAIIAGIAARRRANACLAFVAYLIVVLGFESVVSLWPERFFTPMFLLAQQAFFDAAKLAVAGELAWRAFRAFPGAKAAAQRTFAIILIVTTLSVVFLVPSRDMTDYSFWVRVHLEWEPRILIGTIWLFVATARLVLWYNLPATRWHRAISLGFCAYLVVFVTGFNLLRSLGLEIGPWRGYVDGLAYLTLLLYWAYEAWRPNEDAAWSAKFEALGVGSG